MRHRTMARTTTTTLPSSDHQFVEEEYIDLDLTSCRHSREFEFQMCKNSAMQQQEAILPSADELFYKGRLLPLHKIMMPSSNAQESDGRRSATVAPLQPAGFLKNAPVVRPNTENSRCKKERSVKPSSVCAKLQASRAFLRSLFAKPSCSDETCGNGNVVARSKAPFGQIRQKRYVGSNGSSVATTLRSSIEREKLMEEDSSHRKSFSGVIKWRPLSHSCSASSLSSSSSSSSAVNCSVISGVHRQPMLKRSSSASSEVESLIQGAIAYCKKSQQLVLARKSVNDAGFCSFFA